ncbi:CMRF35-like molecule 5 isoform X2 [Megalobrama amblycephala]|uniref:CMRF35-like molecule 5 isoform X2 n=1 Tax=Megalobrama amblycephala TaxID=75352 RepID=UPI0020142B46|nr:CMRF35-like molecule 5 isoform X2 [Megalobrama amblycephala]
MIWKMKTLMKILCLFVVFSGVLMKSGDVFEGTVGEKVEIKCPYPDDYKYTPKYLCRHPCRSEHVLIKSAKIDQVDQNGRYSLINTVSGRFFTVTIKDLRLKDSGVYYCGLDKWFRDTLKKVHLSVRQAPVDRPSHTPENTIITTTASTWTITLTSADIFHSYEVLPTVLSSGSTPLINRSDVTAVCAGVLSLLVFSILVPLLFIYRKRSDSKFRCKITHTLRLQLQQFQDPAEFKQTVGDVCHPCEETKVVYILDDPPKGDSSSFRPTSYSSVHYCDHMTQEQGHS